MRNTGEGGNMTILNISHVHWEIFSEQKKDYFLSFCLPQNKILKMVFNSWRQQSFTDKKALFWQMNFLTPFPVFSPIPLVGREGATNCVCTHLIARASASQHQIQLGMCNNYKYSSLDRIGSQYLVGLEKYKYWIKILMELGNLIDLERLRLGGVLGDWIHWHSDVLASV